MLLSRCPSGTDMAEPKCPRCFRELSLDDVVESDGVNVVHVDCRRPRDLTRQERALLFGCCWAHRIACPACGQSFQLFELDPDPFEVHKRTRCPRCQTEVIQTVCDHLYACPLSPEISRQRAKETRETARRLVQQAREARDRADVSMREAEVSVSELRDAVRESVSEALRRLIQAKVRQGSLPHGDIGAAILGLPGDGSMCGACEQQISKHHLMMMIPSAAMVIPLHATDCFPLWDEERRTFRPPA